MKNIKLLKSVFVCSATLLFSYLFWDNSLGLNLAVFTFIPLSLPLIFYREALSSTPVRISLIGILLTALLVTYHNSGFAIFTHIWSVFLLVGFTHDNNIKSITYALPTSFIKYFYFHKTIRRAFQSTGFIHTPAIKKGIRFFRLAILPVLVLVLFIFIFSHANPIFGNLIGDLSHFVQLGLEHFFASLSIGRIVFTFWGFTLICWLAVRHNIPRFVQKELTQSDTILRQRPQRSSTVRLSLSNLPPKFGFIALKSEYRSALILLILVNVLLFIINAIDVTWIWFQFDPQRAGNLSQFVHEGTYLLILSILLSMAILLYFFRKNQNFSPYRNRLLLPATIWIFQNMVLVVSVALRNYRYVEVYQLAFKRIGVFVFLLLTLFGLVSLLYKIRKRKSRYFLIKTNAWAVYLTFVLLSIPNWDVFITQYNISHSPTGRLDTTYIVKLSDHTLPLLHREIQLNHHQLDVPRYVRNAVQWRMESVVKRYESGSWPSWSYMNEKTYVYCKKATEYETLNK